MVALYPRPRAIARAKWYAVDQGPLVPFHLTIRRHIRHTTVDFQRELVGNPESDPFGVDRDSAIRLLIVSVRASRLRC